MDRERKLVSVQRIAKLEDMKNADTLQLATILGWQCIVKKGTFKTGDLCVYFEIDSMIPPKQDFEFLRKSCWNERMQSFRIRTMKMRGCISQGLAMPISILPDPESAYEGHDVTVDLCVTKYELPEEFGGATSTVKLAPFPGDIPRTDEPRIQTVPDVLIRNSGIVVYVTEKLDGTSCTIYRRGDHFGVCTRNREVQEGPNAYWTAAKASGLQANPALDGLALQGEVIGPGIQKNRYRLTEIQFHVFNVYSITNKRYLNVHEAMEVASELELNFVPILWTNIKMPETVAGCVILAEGESKLNKEANREGIVVRGMREQWDVEIGRLSFKCLNPTFLLKEETENE